MAVDIALLFPPTWYFTAVPADLSHTAGSLVARGKDTWVWDGSAALRHALFGDLPGFAALRDPATYRDTARHRAAVDSFYARARELSIRFGCDLGPRHLRFDVDESHIPSALARGADLFRNPALALLETTAERVLAQDPTVIAIALVHPDQRVHALTLAKRLRPHHDRVVLYGCLEDVLAPSDFIDGVGADHQLFDLFDAVVSGDADDALAAMCDADQPLSGLPNTATRDRPGRPPRVEQPLITPAALDWVDPTHHPTPAPVVDVRLGRGCPWGRCRFCAIQAHHPGYRAGTLARVIHSIRNARSIGSHHIRVRDDLLTPRQLGELGDALVEEGLDVRWTARARFSSGLTRSALQRARDGGLDELWMGLESAVPRVRALMDKGVEQPIIERVMADCADLGVRVRLLCLLGFPGETAEEARQTLAFARRHPEADVSFTPYMQVRTAPLSLDAPPTDPGVTARLQSRARIDAIVPTQPPPWLDDVLSEMLPIARERADRIPGPGPIHRWLARSV
jgi:hypothetical protein